MPQFFPAALFAALIATTFLTITTESDTPDLVESPASPIGAAKADVEQGSTKVGHPSFMSPHSDPIAINGDSVFVVNTPSDTVDVINRRTRKITARIKVGIDPVSIAVRPDGKEVWVSNHVSDSVSVIDSDPSRPTYLQVIATIQDFDARTKATRFDEPVGIAFADNNKAYIALSSENAIAVVDVKKKAITKRLRITAQDPRAIKVRGNRLYVIPFESNNKTQLSGGSKIDGKLVTFNAWEHSIRVNNVLSLGHVVDIVKHPRVPDRDLFVFDTQTDKLIRSVNTLGTLLYGLTVDSRGNVFVAQTDARNDVNGRSGSKKHGLNEMENRAFLNQITKVRVADGGAEKPSFVDLEPLPPKHPAKGEALATPFAIQISEDDSTLVGSAAGSDKVFTVDAKTGKVLGRVSVGNVPRGIALDSRKGKPAEAWVYNAVGNTVSVVDLRDRENPKAVASIPLKDPTNAAVKRGRIAFNTASASTTGTFSCASCHPDGHTDQLLWVLKTPIVTGGKQIMPRSTMPIRGLRDTAPFHWDGIPGDPYGGINSASIRKGVKPNSDPKNPKSSPRHLIDGGLATTMHLVGDKTVNDEGKAGKLTARERDDMATFLLSVPYPPAQRRAYTNVVSEEAKKGFKLFHIDGDDDPKQRRPNVCGNCHRMPFLVSTNTPGTGMDAPTWRGAYDRFLILPQGRLNIIDFPFYRRVAEQGQSERSIWQFSWGGRRRFNPVWNMVLEGSTGYSGALGRQVTLNSRTASDTGAKDLLNALEQAARENAIVLEVDGVFLDKKQPQSITLQFADGKYTSSGGFSTTRKKLSAMAVAGDFVGTFTARHGEKADVDHPQPAIWTRGPIEKQSRLPQRFPILHAKQKSMTISGRHVDPGAMVIINGRKVAGRVSLGKNESLTVHLTKLPAVGMHLLQLQNPGGMFSNDFIIHVAKDSAGADELQAKLDSRHIDAGTVLVNAVDSGNLDRVKRALGKRARGINARRGRDGSTALNAAAFRGHTEIFNYLIKRGANIKQSNRDGNTPLHVAAFMCRKEMVGQLLKKGASPRVKNRRGQSAIDIVSSPWDKTLENIYVGITRGASVKISIKRLKEQRPQVAKMLRDQVAKKE